MRFATPDGEVHAVRDLSFELKAGETLGIVGESGSGKTQSVLSLLGSARRERPRERRRAVRRPRSPRAARARAPGRSRPPDLDDLSRPDDLAEPVPHDRSADGAGAARARARVREGSARSRCIEMLDAVAIPEAGRALRALPARALGRHAPARDDRDEPAARPALLIADEPTTALDVTVQAQILDLMRSFKRRFDTAIILITHDLGVIAGLADRVLVMQGGELKEQGPVDDVFYRPQHPYTRALLAAVPRLDCRRARATDGRARSPRSPRACRSVTCRSSKSAACTCSFPVAGGGWWSPRTLKAVDGVGLALAPGETLGVVGESGSGKSTLARAILKLVPGERGQISRARPRPAALRAARACGRSKRNVQMVFQDPLASLNPRMTVGDIVSEPLWTHRPELAPRPCGRAWSRCCGGRA